MHCTTSLPRWTHLALLPEVCQCMPAHPWYQPHSKQACWWNKVGCLPMLVPNAYWLHYCMGQTENKVPKPAQAISIQMLKDDWSLNCLLAALFYGANWTQVPKPVQAISIQMLKDDWSLYCLLAALFYGANWKQVPKPVQAISIQMLKDDWSLYWLQQKHWACKSYVEAVFFSCCNYLARCHKVIKLVVSFVETSREWVLLQKQVVLPVVLQVVPHPHAVINFAKINLIQF